MRKLRILVSPLDWGLGHATRCIPIISSLLENRCEVLVGADGRALELLKEEFPSLQFIRMPGYDLSYPAGATMAFKMAASIPRILKGIKAEHEQLAAIIKEYAVDAVISDNRFGLWHKNIPCVFITHQLMIKSPLGENILHRLNKRYIKRFSACWVPDVAGENNLSGDLAHQYPLPANAGFIGPLSRFSPAPSAKENGKILVLLSGPEPQRSILEKKLLRQLMDPGRPALLVRGVTENQERKKITKETEVINYMTGEELQKELSECSVVIARSGYSTIMDLAVLKKKKIIFIPTPGQTEQEYLAQRFSKMNVAYSASQKKFELGAALAKVNGYNGFNADIDPSSFREKIRVWISSLR